MMGVVVLLRIFVYLADLLYRSAYCDGFCRKQIHHEERRMRGHVVCTMLSV